MLTGGGQEGGRRAGTENVAGIVAIGMAAECGRRHLETVAAGHDPVAALRDEFEREVGARLAGVTVNGAGAERTPNTSSLRVAGVEAAAMMVLLDQRGVCVSAGSACHTGTHAISPVLAAMGLGAAEARETLRVSLSRLTTAAEIREAVDAFVWAAGRVCEVMGQGPR
jgi:cysteine desulfurase